VVPGCGTGELERDLVAKGLCRRALAFDLSPRQVAEARERAHRAGVAGAIDYRTAAMEELDLPEGAFDGCFFHHSLHHAEDPEGLLRKLRRALRPGALLYLDEYVGPSRRQWNRRSYAAAVDAYRQLPATVRRHRRLHIPGLLAKLSDPSESIASDRIVPAVEELFEVRLRRDYGGFLLHPVWQQIHHPPEVVDLLIEEEEERIGDHPTWYAVIVARVT
jgi:SAM-dependent methyltransferase